MLVLPGRLEARVLEGSYVIMSMRNFETALDPLSRRILVSIAKGSSRFSDLLRETKIPKGQLARRLRALVKSGWLTKVDRGSYTYSSSVYVVSDVQEVDESISMRILRDHGAFLDPQYGLVIFKGSAAEYCSACPLRKACVANVKALAKKYGVKLHAVEPAEAYVEVFMGMIRNSLVKGFREGKVNLRAVT